MAVFVNTFSPLADIQSQENTYVREKTDEGSFAVCCWAHQIPFNGRAQWMRRIVDLEEGAQVGRCSCVDDSVVECQSFSPDEGNHWKPVQRDEQWCDLSFSADQKKSLLTPNPDPSEQRVLGEGSKTDSFTQKVKRDHEA